VYFIKTNAGNCIVRYGASDFSILNYDCHYIHTYIYICICTYVYI